MCTSLTMRRQQTLPPMPMTLLAKQLRSLVWPKEMLETGARTWSSPSLSSLLSSAARSSLITILLLLPVFFLQPTSRLESWETTREIWTIDNIVDLREREICFLTLWRTLNYKHESQHSTGVHHLTSRLGPVTGARPASASPLAFFLPLPGLLWLRSFFFSQSSFFSRRHGQVPEKRDNPRDTRDIDLKEMMNRKLLVKAMKTPFVKCFETGTLGQMGPSHRPTWSTRDWGPSQELTHP